MRVLLAGGSGFIGSHLVEELRDRGHQVTVLARSPETAEVPRGVDTVSGDITDHDTLKPAVEGQAAVVNLVALSPLTAPGGGEKMHEQVHRQGTENLVRAASAGGVERYVQVSALGADPAGATAYIRAKGRAEKHVAESDLDWVIIRPSVVFGPGGEFISFTKKVAFPYLTPLPGGGRTRFQPIFVEDLAVMLADSLEADEHVGETYEIGGPEKLSLADVARLVHQADARSVNVLPVPMVLVWLALAVGDKVPGFPMGLDQYRALQFDNTTADNDLGAFGLDAAELTTLRSYLDL